MDVNEELKFLGKFKKKNWRGVGGGGGLGIGLGGQDGCERRIEVFVKIQIKKLGGGGGFRVDVNEGLKFLGKLKKNGGVGGLGGSGWGGG